MGNSASSEQQQQQEEEATNQNAYSKTNNNYTTSQSIKINQPKASENQSLDKTTPSISYSSPLSPPIPGMMQQVINNNNDSNNNNDNDNNQDNNNISNNNDNSATETTTTNNNNNNNTNINNTGNTNNSNNNNPISSTTTASDTTTLPKPVPGRSGWVSSTGASSPWYGGGSLSSSASSTHPQPYGSSYQQQQQQTKSSHRQSISGPYYRARGMSVNQQQEPNDDDINNNNNQQQQHQQQQLLQPSPSTSTSQQLPRLQLQQLQINSPSLSSPLSTTKPESLPKEKSTPGIPTIITWSHGGNNVYVTGTFNGWKHKIPLVKSTHDFSTVIDLPLGTNRLKFIVDDEWKCSNEMETATDPDGNLVNYLQVLDEDDVEDDSDIFRREGNGGNNVNKYGDENDDEDDDDDQYTNVIPEELTLLAEAVQTAATDPHSMDQQKRDAIEWERKQPQPPTLPPHLEKVLLNSQNVSEEDNSILPTPNHVTLNHLYACSIKDQVMALSTTTRYRKKYVTTMYYRPVQQ